jgi:hypothetical protein
MVLFIFIFLFPSYKLNTTKIRAFMDGFFLNGF